MEKNSVYRIVCPSIILAVLSLNFVLFLHQSFSYGNPGHKPVEDTLGYDDNYLYKKWCEEMFENGGYVYEGYRKIAFDIEYTPEELKVDFWQLPVETARLKKGDCEDATLLFMDYLAQSQDDTDANIVWGWVINKRSTIGRAHVWCELAARDGERYIVEGFSDEWNGIIPMEIVEECESRKTIFRLSCSEFNRLFKSSPNEWNIRVDYKEVLVTTDGDYITYGDRYMTDRIILRQNPDNRTGIYNKKEVESILDRLHELFSRQRKGE